MTTLGVLRFSSETREAYLASYHPFSSPEAVQRATGWPLRVDARCEETKGPTRDELRLIREADPLGFWTRPRVGTLTSANAALS